MARVCVHRVFVRKQMEKTDTKNMQKYEGEGENDDVNRYVRW